MHVTTVSVAHGPKDSTSGFQSYRAGSSFVCNTLEQREDVCWECLFRERQKRFVSIEFDSEKQSDASTCFRRARRQICRRVNVRLLRPPRPHCMLSTLPRDRFTSLSSSPAAHAHTDTPAAKSLMSTTPVLFVAVTMATQSFPFLSLSCNLGLSLAQKHLPLNCARQFIYFFLKWVIHVPSKDFSQT